jgi:predicted nucleotidyltransferase component of viral defense system
VITRADIVERANAWGLSEAVVEKDYVLGWLLWGIGAHPVLSRYWAFKGGTCLKKCYFETYRFSEDLDFSVLPGSPFQDADQAFDLAQVNQALGEMTATVEDASGLDLSTREFVLKTRNNGRALEGHVYYLGPAGSTKTAKLKLDISGTEVVVRPTVTIPIRHGFPDTLPGPATIRAYCFEEVFAEKIRAMGERGRPRDLYDIVNLYRHRGLRRDAQEIRAVLRVVSRPAPGVRQGVAPSSVPTSADSTVRRVSSTRTLFAPGPPGRAGSGAPRSAVCAPPRRRSS